MPNRILFSSLLLLFALATPALGFDLEETWEEWLDIGEYFTMVDEKNNIILETGRRIYEGDQYLTADNQLYEVTFVDEDTHTAHAEWLKEVVLSDRRFGRHASDALAVASADDPIGIYHTHNAESYVPTDGTDSIDGKGGIHAVGATFDSALNSLGVETLFSENLHLPHDAGAYRRSRETVLELLAQNPIALFDVHRDAAPRDAYKAELGGDVVTQVQFVVGTQNQNIGVNREYAESLKRAADEIHPGLVKGIFFGRGNYNQDLTPLNILLEVGAHTNTREAAERGITLFADVVDYYFFGPADQRTRGTSLAGIAGNRTIVAIVFFLLAGGTGFYVINAGGWAAAWENIRGRFK